MILSFNNNTIKKKDFMKILETRATHTRIIKF